MITIYILSRIGVLGFWGRGGRSSRGRKSESDPPISTPQRVNASGIPQWTADGVGLCTAAN